MKTSFVKTISLLSTALALSVTSAFVYAASSASAQDTDAFYLKDGDRVVFYGDSITDQRLYTTFAETFVVTRFPDKDVRFVHSGWGGDRVGGGGGGKIDTRLDRDVFAWEPSVVTIMLGMNDGQYRTFDQNIFNTYKNGLTSIVKKIDETLPDARITLIRPSPYDDYTREPRFKGGYNEVLIRYGDAVEQLATASGHQVADLNADLSEVLKVAKGKNAELSTQIVNDRVHPGAAGHLIMAGSLLEAWNAPAIVSEVVIAVSGTTARVVSTVNADVTNLKDTAGVLSWTQLDKALPLPVNFGDKALALAVESSDFIESLNRQPLRVSGLSAPYYQLQIDDEIVGTYKASEFTEGLNLAILPTPMLKQAEKVHALTLRRANTHQTRWRSMQVPYANAQSEEMTAALPQILAAFDAEVDAIRKLQREAAQPVAHQFKLVPQEAVLSSVGAGDPLLPDGLGRNLALNKKWVSSSLNTYGWDSGLTDGSWKAARSTTYASGNDNTFPKTVTVDLEQPETLTCVVTGVPPFGSTKTVIVSLSEDDTNYKEVGSYAFSTRKEEKRVFPFEPTRARYVRLTYPDHHSENVNYDPTYVFITDLQAYGQAGK